MDEAEIEALLFGITDEQAMDSDEGGDSDADDELPVLISTSTVTRRLDNSITSTSSKETINISNEEVVGTPSTSSGVTTESVRQTRKRGGSVIYSDLYLEKTDFSSDDTDDDPTYNPLTSKSADPFSHISESSSTNSAQPSVDQIDLDLNCPKKKQIKRKKTNKKSEESGMKSVVSKDKGKKELKYKWSKIPENPKLFEDSNYDLPFGIIVDEIDYTNCTLIFKNIIDDDICNVIIEQSNTYAVQKGNNLEITKDELYAFLGILIFMGFHHLPSIRLYWSEDQNFQVTRVSKVMPLKRFLKILRFLHINDNTKIPTAGTPTFDKLFKIRPLLDHLSQKYSELFAPSRFLSIDESMAPFKGRSMLKQYMPKKPIKRGFKIWAITCAVTGFLLRFEVYTGKKSGHPELGLGENVVLSLSEPYLEQNRCLYFDNFFSSISLFDTLLDKSTFACGTIRADRVEFPVLHLKSDKELSKHEHDFAQCQNPKDISIVKWKDRGSKAVAVISNNNNPSKTEIVLRTNQIGVREEVVCPSAIAEYNRFMGGVDLFDQHMSPYSISRKSRKWWIKLVYYFIESAVVNSFILHQQYSKQKKIKSLTHLQFRSSLVNGLIDTFSSRKRKGPPPSAGFCRKRNNPDGRRTIENTVRLTNVGDHMPMLVAKYRRCAFCSTKAKEKRSNMICKTCDVALCKMCFGPFHSR